MKIIVHKRYGYDIHKKTDSARQNIDSMPLYKTLQKQKDIHIEITKLKIINER